MNLRLVGLIVMIGGVIGLIISLAFMISRRQRHTTVPPAKVYEERRYHEPPL